MDRRRRARERWAAASPRTSGSITSIPAALYRGVALGVLRAGGDPGDPEVAAAAARTLKGSDLEDPGLRDEAVGEAASRVAAIGAVREALLAFQQSFAANPPGGVGAVLDGRDIGTVVCPGAQAKLFVVASLEAPRPAPHRADRGGRRRRR